MGDTQSEPQDFDIQSDSASAPENETPNTEATDDHGGDDVSQEPKVTFDEGQQAKVNELIGGKVAKQRAAEQRAEAAEAQLAQMQSQVPTLEAPAIPEQPDPDDYFGDDAGLQAARAARDEAIEKRAEWNSDQRNAEKQTAEQAQKQGLEAAQKQQEQQEAYVGTAESFGIKPDQVTKEANTVSQYLSNDIQDYIVQDPQGPLISNFLSKDLVELDKVRSMHPLQAAVYIANEIKPKLAGMKKQTQAPDPADIVGGQGAPSKKHPALEGVIFE